MAEGKSKQTCWTMDSFRKAATLKEISIERKGEETGGNLFLTHIQPLCHHCRLIRKKLGTEGAKKEIKVPGWKQPPYQGWATQEIEG
jgi:hypothetical protein